jgi:magnesium transporter
MLFAAGMLTAWSLRHYESKLNLAVWLVWFLPLVNSSGGNTGSQSATLVITALAAGDLSLKHWRRIVLRELAMGLTLGSFLAAMGVVASMLINPDWTWMMVCVFPLTLLSVVVVGTVVGSMLPLLFERMGLDPALMSNPFVSGIMDVVGITTYMNVAAWLLTQTAPPS